MDELVRSGVGLPDGLAGLDLYWIPLGAGAQVVRISGRIYERIVAFIARRPRRDLFLYHSALAATTPDGRVMIEMAPTPDNRGRTDRGVVAEGPVGSRLLGRSRVFRYEIRRWRNGEIPDLVHAVASPVRVADDPQLVTEVVDLVASVPTPVRSWVLTRAGLLDASSAPPENGRAPGWDAGIVAARRTMPVHHAACQLSSAPRHP